MGRMALAKPGVGGRGCFLPPFADHQGINDTVLGHENHPHLSWQLLPSIGFPGTVQVTECS